MGESSMGLAEPSGSMDERRLLWYEDGMEMGCECPFAPTSIVAVPGVLTMSRARWRKVLVDPAIGLVESKLEADEKEAVELVDDRR